MKETLHAIQEVWSSSAFAQKVSAAFNVAAPTSAQPATTADQVETSPARPAAAATPAAGSARAHGEASSSISSTSTSSSLSKPDFELGPPSAVRRSATAPVLLPATPPPAPLEWEVWNKEYPAPIAALSDVIFGPCNRFWLELFASRLYFDVSMSDWIDGVRTVKYTMPRKGLQGKTAVESTESITVKAPGVIVVEIETHTPGVPYGSSFCTCAQYQFKAAGPSSGTVLTTASVKWLKSCSLKGTITKKIKEGMTKGMKETLHAIGKKWAGLSSCSEA